MNDCVQRDDVQMKSEEHSAFTAIAVRCLRQTAECGTVRRRPKYEDATPGGEAAAPPALSQASGVAGDSRDAGALAAESVNGFAMQCARSSPMPRNLPQ